MILLRLKILIKYIAKVKCCKIVGRRFSTAYHFYTAVFAEKKFGGAGILLAGVPGTPKANVVILGGGTVGTNACKIAVGMGANVTILDVNLKRLEDDREQ